MSSHPCWKTLKALRSLPKLNKAITVFTLVSCHARLGDKKSLRETRERHSVNPHFKARSFAFVDDLSLM